MTIPSPVIASDDLDDLIDIITLTVAAPYVDVLVQETATHSPAASARQWKSDGSNIVGATAADVTLRFVATDGVDGEYDLTCSVTNADGTAASSARTVTVNDEIEEAVAEELDDLGVTVLPRVASANLPWEWHDPTCATPGLPTARALYCAQQYGSVLPSADRPAAITFVS